MELNYLIDGVTILGNCQPGMEQLKSCENVNDLIQCFYDRIDYCLANNFPDKDFLLQYRDELRAAGVYIDENISIDARPRIVLLGQSECELTLDKYAISRVYVKHKSKLHIKARDCSIIMIDALDNAIIHVDAGEKARVIVNMYATSKCNVISGNPRIVQKNRFTYEL